MYQLKLSQQQSILTLHQAGWSNRAIARELILNRETVGKYLRSQAAPLTEVSAGTEPPKPAISTPGSGAEANSKPAISTAGSVAGRKSCCAAWEQQITTALEQGLSAQRIYQDLVTKYQFNGSYQAVKRYVRRLAATIPLPFRRMECVPGQELQVDFGQGAWVIENGKRRRPHLFRGVLSHSRKGYSEAVWQQTTESFIRCLENAFRHYGGVTVTVVIDNLKAGVIQADWFDPELNPKLEEFARHYGTVILPTKPAMPRHKGKVESAVKYAQNNAVAGRTFTSLAEQNLFLAEWERTVADTRIHGTTRQQVGKLFAAAEQAALRALPVMVFPVFEEAPRTVHRDGYVEFRRAYYSAPPEYVGLQVWVRRETRLVRLYNTRREQIALHAEAEPGRFTTDPVHLHSRKRHIIERGADYLLDRCRLVGPQTGTWAEQMFAQRGPQGLRVMLGLLHLAEKHPLADLERAALSAAHYGAWRLRDLKRLLDQPGNVVQLQFLETHPLIRPLDAYRIPLPATPPPHPIP